MRAVPSELLVASLALDARHADDDHDERVEDAHRPRDDRDDPHHVDGARLPPLRRCKIHKAA